MAVRGRRRPHLPSLVACRPSKYGLCPRPRPSILNATKNTRVSSHSRRYFVVEAIFFMPVVTPKVIAADGKPVRLSAGSLPAASGCSSGPAKTTDKPRSQQSGSVFTGQIHAGWSRRCWIWIQFGYDGLYGGYYDQPTYENPNSLFTSTGPVLSKQPSKPISYTRKSHPSPYTDTPTFFSSKPRHRGGGGREYRWATIFDRQSGFPASLPGQSTANNPSACGASPVGTQKVQLSDTPVIGGGAGGFTTCTTSRHSRPLGPPRVGSAAERHKQDRFGVGDSAQIFSKTMIAYLPHPTRRALSVQEQEAI
ncbi:hypothetical protein PIIN_10167 [Serendipita indica DSM 11827]|uniref:Uncharacterized protein n=1 Tax=Serendipita indica (strain DSM 11827) TaxID=1109443 RepID=G4TXX6_SERID|nr:hypothetical protein PIIN_10167 [Serendipita indica DSM 11827]